MRILIAGAGEVGYHLAKLLSVESQNITLIDVDKERLKYADHHLDIKTLKGDATSISLLKEARIEDTDLTIGVTASESVNLTLCYIAKQMGSKKTIARISNAEFIDFNEALNFKAMGVDELISPEKLAATEIKMLLDQSAFNETCEFEEGKLILAGICLSETAPFIGKTVAEAASVFPEVHYNPVAIQRSGTQYTIIPRSSTEFKEGDQVYFVTSKEGFSELYKMTGTIKEKLKNVMIMGGSKVGKKTTRDLCEKKFNVKIIEKNEKKAEELADMFPNALVIRGDGSNVELLKEENLESMDAFIAVTGNSETNIMSCLVAKSQNVKKTIALVENMDYFQLSHSIGIDALINKKLIAANEIFRYVRKGEVLALARLNSLEAEILEFAVSSNSAVANEFIRDINIPKSAIIGGVIRGEEGIIVDGDFKVKEGDRMIVCCLPSAIRKTEKLFV
jgi:trk system potassium uptake protein TrkA